MACSITWRQPEIQPLDPLRVYPVGIAAACAGIDTAIEQMGLQIATSTSASDACMVETDPKRLTDTGASENHLDRVAFTGSGSFFAHGRFRLTTVTRPTAEGNSRVRVTTRIEGYDGGYRPVRSTGLIEQAVFDRLEQILGAAPLQR